MDNRGLTPFEQWHTDVFQPTGTVIGDTRQAWNAALNQKVGVK